MKIDIEKLHALFTQNEGVFTDTRKVIKGGVFFALKGENFDGNTFALKAIDAGAKYAVVDRVEKSHEQLIVVDDALKTLQDLATFHRRFLNIPIVALTGSNGKTTTKELIYAVLSQRYKVVATKGNLNNHIGVPLTLLSMDKNTEMGVVEMGANHSGEIASLSAIAEPDYGYITNFGKAHLEGFGGIEGVIKAKSELYDFLRKHHKTIFVNGDDSMQIEQSKGAKQYLIGESKTADINVFFGEANPFAQVSFMGEMVESHLIGKYNAKNIAAAIGIGHYFRVNIQAIKKGIEQYNPKNNRSQILKKNEQKIILDAYNANPTSMAAALESFSTLKGKHKMVILGDMFEVGADSIAEHEAIVSLLEKYKFDACFLCGKNFFETQKKSSNIQWFEDFSALKNTMQTTSLQKGLILVKGSRGMALERIFDYI